MNTPATSQKPAIASSGVVASSRGLLGRLFKRAFIAFNILMALALLVSWSLLNFAGFLGDSIPSQIGVFLGGGLATLAIFVLWAIGFVVLGLPTYLTRGRLSAGRGTVRQ